MKRIILLFVAVTMMACGGSKTVRVSKKVIKGNWSLNTITYSKAGTYDVTLLNDASKSCFEGSTWQFIPNNNTGVYSIGKYACESGDRHFIFTIDEVDKTTGLYDFLLKPTDEKGNSETNKGFRLSLTSLSDTQMQWQQTVIVDNQPFTISMNFDKL
ncbi:MULTISPECIES: lipocalin family protein [Aestuariibaculum]|uniref:Lipocalin family protein n=1 Tax=Aestuariibaculum marinum TaxID=2683592 RepID=A0A8J6U881_9FLAO|nr:MULTISPECIES: lipocalin family protein [Aestuariibaculum]MBD0823451.1 lipocalin family protein [Aestuariibaculum marinum]WMI66539.1 lipocalin family protein [Aestuariibaculum sp. YM273]